MKSHEKLSEALQHSDSTIKRVCRGFFADARAAAKRAKELKDAAGIAQLFAGEQTKELRGLYEDSKLQALRALEFADDKEFEKEIRQKFEDFDKVFAEKKSGQE